MIQWVVLFIGIFYIGIITTLILLLVKESCNQLQVPMAKYPRLMMAAAALMDNHSPSIIKPMARSANVTPQEVYDTLIDGGLFWDNSLHLNDSTLNQFAMTHIAPKIEQMAPPDSATFSPDMILSGQRVSMGTPLLSLVEGDIWD